MSWLRRRSGTDGRLAQRATLLATFEMPPAVLERARQRYPDVPDAAWGTADLGLRQLFYAFSARSRGAVVAMPSRLVDAVWHEFILDTRAYAYFCSTVLGEFLHHTPETSMTAGEQARYAEHGLRVAWDGALTFEATQGRTPETPALFTADVEAGLATEAWQPGKADQVGAGSDGAAATVWIVAAGSGDSGHGDSSGHSGSSTGDGSGSTDGGGGGGGGGCGGGGCGGS